LFNFEDIPLISPFFASIPETYSAKKIIPVCSNYFLEESLIQNKNALFNLPSNGTVAGSALFSALMLTSGPVFLSGLDFSFIDCLSHVRPHSFDILLEQRADRINPVKNIYFNRNIFPSERFTGSKHNRRTSYALKTYGGWFASISRNISERCYFLDYFSNPPGHFKTISYNNAAKLLSPSLQSLPILSTINAPQKREIILRNFLLSLFRNFEKTKEECEVIIEGSELFKLLNNDYIFNLFLPDLLEFKKHFINITDKTATKKACSIIDKILFFLEDFLIYVQ
ncbi:MAG: hypothetical protein PQJ46_03690, partial [Spirochaetales bacterium]|nr:hypothetical protein [Spirochaetales bacterium]